MKISFDKYQGAGNDFIMLDNRSGVYSSLSQLQLKKLCDRNYGIGADGIILVETTPEIQVAFVGMGVVVLLHLQIAIR